jgi:Lipid A 3-O-deacylase (PagL)
VCESGFALWRSERYFAGNVRLNCLSILAMLCFLAPQLAHSQEAKTAVETNIPQPTNTIVETNIPQATNTEVETDAQATNTVVKTNNPTETGAVITPKTTPGKRPVESEIIESGMITYGNYRVFGAAARCNIWSAGVEYDRHIWGHWLKARVDYVVEVLPFVVLSEPAKADFWGNPESPNQQLVHGLGMSPFGFRFLWRSNARVKPFLIGKAGVIAFPKKVLSTAGSYANFNFQGDFGVQIRLTERVDLRLDPLVYFHVSNGYFAASNPGFDQLGAKFGISYRLGKQEH